MYSGEPLPERVVSANAYLGALPIARSLAAGADIVVTGRVVDSALALGPLMHEFGWTASDYDLLAAGSLAGHIIECGCQATGGLFTDWESVPDWAIIGYPIAECSADGTLRVTKPHDTGGLVARGAVAEQLLYEIGDPGAYVLPDVVCDFRDVTIEQDDPQHVRVRGARGLAPTDTYKVSATSRRLSRRRQLIIVGIDAVEKAQRTGEAIFERTGGCCAKAASRTTPTHVEVIGAETWYGPPLARAERARRCCGRRRPRRHGGARTARARIAPAGTSWSPGTTGGGGRASASPSSRSRSCSTTPREPEVRVDSETVDVPVPAGSRRAGAAAGAAAATHADVAERLGA